MLINETTRAEIIFKLIPALIISLISNFPLPKITALGGVAIGSIKAQLAAIVVGITKNIGLIWAMIFGFCLDINQEILLGSHVILFLFLSHFTQRYFHRLRALYTVQQSLFVAIIVLIYQIFLIFFLSEFSDTIIIELVLMTVMAALIWPIIFGILRQLRIKFVQSN